MSEFLQILLNSEKNVNSVDVDTYQKFEVENKVLPILEYNIKNAMSATEVFDAEREYYESYRIYGRIEYLSMLNGLINSYKMLSDFFLPKKDLSKNIYNSFDFYLMKVATGYTKIGGTTTDGINTTTTTESPRVIVIDEDFDDWVINNPSHPVGWSGTTGSTGTKIEKTATNQLEFIFGTTLLNLASIQKKITPIFGYLTFETNISVSPSYSAGDSLIISFSSNGVWKYSSQLLIDGISGYKTETVYMSSEDAIDKVGIFGGSNGKSIYVDYFRLYQKDTNSSDGSNDTIPNAPSNSYVRYFEVIATPDDLDLYDAGFSTNVYGEQVYTYNYNRDFDVSSYVGINKFPATELFIYAKYKTDVNGNKINETLSGVTWDATTGKPKNVAIPSGFLNVGDIVYGDIIEYSKSQFLQFELIPQTYFISTPYKDSLGVNQRLQWKYNPFIPLRLRYFRDELNKANTGSTTYSEQISIPYYATNYPEGTANYVWRDILPQGFIDPTTGLGVDYPFINKNRYLFSRNILDVRPNMNDEHTANVFTEIRFDNPTVLAITPNSDINNIGKPCQ